MPLDPQFHRFAIGADHGGVELRLAIIKLLRNRGFAVEDFGTDGAQSVDYPDFAKAVCLAVQHDQHCFGILICGSGIGMSIAANRFDGIRAALCHSVQTAELSRQHNDANVLCLGARVLSEDLALSMVEAWLNADFEGGRHVKRLSLLERGCCPSESETLRSPAAKA